MNKQLVMNEKMQLNDLINLYLEVQVLNYYDDIVVEHDNEKHQL